MLRIINLILLAIICTGCFSVRVPLNQPPKTYAQEIKAFQNEAETFNHTNLPSTLKPALVFATFGYLLGLVSYDSETKPTTMSYRARSTNAIVGGVSGLSVGYLYGYIHRQRLSYRAQEKHPSKLPSILALTISGASISNLGVYFGQKSKPTSKQQAFATAYGIAATFPMGYALGKMIQLERARKNSTNINTTLSEETKYVKQKDNGLFLTTLPTYLFGFIGYRIGHQQIWNQNIRRDSLKQEDTGLVGAVAGGSIGFFVGQLIHDRMNSYLAKGRVSEY